MRHAKKVCFLCLLIILSVTFVAAQEKAQEKKLHAPDVIYLPTPDEVVEQMLKMADVHKGDVVYDLGCGDGRLVIAAAKLGARGVGIDINPERIKESRENARKAGVTDHVTFRTEDLFEADIKDATVVTLYLLQSLNIRLRPKLWADLKPGTRIVSHDFDMGDWAPEKEIRLEVEEMTHTVYRWTIPAKPPASAR